MSSVISNNLSLKCQRCTPFGCKDIGIGIFDFVAKTQFLWKNQSEGFKTLKRIESLPQTLIF